MISGINNISNIHDQTLVGGRISDPNIKYVNKFGKYNTVTSGSITATVWPGASISGAELYTPSTTNDITHVSSSSTLDTALLEIEGLDSTGHLHTQLVTLAGQTKTALTTPLLAVNRMRYFVRSSIYINGNQGDIYCYVDDTVTAGVPDTKNKIRGIILQNECQTQQLHYTVPSNYDAVVCCGNVTFTSFSAAGKSAILSWVGAVWDSSNGEWYAPFIVGNIELDSSIKPTFTLEYGTPEYVSPLARLWIQVEGTNDATAGIEGRFDLKLIKKD